MSFKKITLVFLLIFYSIFIPLMADELWLSQSSDSNNREFITVDYQPESFELIIYEQIKGEYQDVKLKKSFLKLEDLQKFIQNEYKNFNKIELLDFWPTIYEEDNDDHNIEIQGRNDIWTSYYSWSSAWEYRYAQWLTEVVTPDFFIRYNIAVDCADVAIALRWIFARINALPAANTVAGGNNLFGNHSMKRAWQKYSTASNWFDDQRFRVALDYILDATSTRTILAYDGFPVALNTNGLMAGTFIVSNINNAGHLRIITENHFNDSKNLPIYTHASTSPREVRSMYREPFIDQAWPIKSKREIMAFRWPIQYRRRWILNSKTNDYRYSTEQFSTTLPPRYYSFIHYVLERTNPNYEPASLVTNGIDDITSYINLRIQIVEDGFNHCQNYPCPKGSRAYDDWSTPSRDYNMKTKFLDTENLIQTFDPLYPGILDAWNAALENTNVMIQDTALSFERIRYFFINNLMSSNPNSSIKKRWGLEP